MKSLTTFAKEKSLILLIAVAFISLFSVSCGKGSAPGGPITPPPPPPVDTALSVTVGADKTIPHGTSTSFDYQTKNAVRVTIVPGEADQPLSGSYPTPTLFTTTDYIVTGFRANGSSLSKTIRLTVTSPSPKTVLLTQLPWFNDSTYTQTLTPTVGSLVGTQMTGCTRDSKWWFNNNGTFTYVDHCSGNSPTGVWSWTSNQDSLTRGGETWGVKELTSSYMALRRVVSIPGGTGIMERTYKH